MADYNSPTGRYGQAAPSAATAGVIDEGLRAHMLRVYNYMMIGLAVTGLFAIGSLWLLTTSTPNEFAMANGYYLNEMGSWFYGAQVTPSGVRLNGSIPMWILMLAPLGLVFFLSFRVHKMSVSAAQTTFWVFAALFGASLAHIFLFFSIGSITQVFFIAAAMFGAMSLWGYTTKRDLTGMGSFLFMGLIGLIIAMIVNLFLGSSAIDFIISIVGVLIFTGLTAYDTQKIKEMYYANDDGTVAGRKAIMGALALYLDFINLFLMLLRLLGNRD